jgi:hypothetical protein
MNGRRWWIGGSPGKNRCLIDERNIDNDRVLTLGFMGTMYGRFISENSGVDDDEWEETEINGRVQFRAAMDGGLARYLRLYGTIH